MLHAGSVRNWYGSVITRQLSAADFTDGSPSTALQTEFNLQELSLVSGPCKVDYQQEQQKRKSQGDTFPSQVDVTGESFSLSIPQTSLHQTAGDELRRILSGGFITGGILGQQNPGPFQQFSLLSVGENFYIETGSADYLVGVIFAGSCPGFSFEESDEAFAEIEAKVEANYGPNRGIGVAQVFSL